MSFASWWDENIAAPFSDIYHHIFAGGDSIKDRYEKKERNWYKDELTKINEKYNLCLSPKTIEDESNLYGEYKRDKKYGNTSWSLNYNSNLGLTGNLTQNLTNNTLNFLQNYISHLSQETLSDLNMTKKQIHLQQNKIIEKRETLTQILMKDPFPIFANGALYKKGIPGSKSYDPLTPYEPYKYITGDISPNEYDDILMGRNHLKLAGNRDYLSNVWEEPDWTIPDRDRKNKDLEAYIFARQKQFNDGFEEVNQLGWTSGGGKIGELDYIKRTQFKKLIKTLPKKFNISEYSGF